MKYKTFQLRIINLAKQNVTQEVKLNKTITNDFLGLRKQTYSHVTVMHQVHRLCLALCIIVCDTSTNSLQLKRPQ